VAAIKGLEKFTPKDFPGFISSTIFLGGCNFRCPYCHNPDLVARPESLADIPLDFFLAYLDARRGWLEGICVSGGEPLAAPDLEELLLILKGRNVLVKLDTNGSRPDRLARLFEAGLIDHVAMDIKSPPARYAEVTRSRIDPAAIERSVEIVRNSGRPYQFRTTIVPGLVGQEDVRAISDWLNGSAVYQIQAFSPMNTLDPEFGKIRPSSAAEMKALADIARPYFGEVRIEGI
jgi:pyruvate formate lyase activating enzyme